VAGRNDGWNAAFTDLLFNSGLRLREGGCLLTAEVPGAATGHCYYEGSVAGAVACKPTDEILIRAPESRPAPSWGWPAGSSPD
jgi:hypothetical protein